MPTTTSSSVPTSETDPPPEPFPNIVKLREEHAKLLAKAADSDGYWEEVRAFVRSACATGATLEADDDRFSAQRLITYWVNALCRSNKPTLAQTVLDEYKEPDTTDLPDSKRPYTTPDEFDRAEGELIGWSRLTRECLDRLRDNGLVAVVGHSGSGRNTLVNVGVLPKLRKGAITGSERWRLIGPMRVGPDPLAALAAAAGAAPAAVEAEAALIRTDPHRFGQLLDAGDPSNPAFLLIDHFDELLATTKRDDIKPCIAALLTLRDQKRHAILLTLRSDSLPQIASFDGLNRAVEAGRVFLMFTNQELRQAIENPAHGVGLRFDPGVVDRLLNDVQGDPTAGPLLQFSLLQLWDNRDGNRITRETYEKLGGGRVALRRTAERVYLALEKKGHAEAARIVFTALVRQEVGREPSRKTVSRAEFHKLADPAQVDDVLEQLVKSRLVARLNDDRFVLVHGALIEVWPQLNGWIADYHHRWAVLRAAADKWRESGFSPSLLWGGVALAEAEGYTDLDPLQSKFLRHSRRRERRAARTRRFLTLGGVVLALILLALVFGVREAQQRAKLAEEKNRTDEEAAKVKLATAESAAKASEAAKVNVRMSLMATDVGLFRAGEDAQKDSEDISGAILWYCEALRLLDASNAVLAPDEYAFLRDNLQPRLGIAALRNNLQLRLGIAARRLPVVQRLITSDPMAGAVFSTGADGKPDRRWVATWVAPNTSGSNVVRVWNLADPGGASQALDTPARVDAVAFGTSGKNDGIEFLLTAGAGSTRGTGHAKLWSRKRAGNEPWKALVERTLTFTTGAEGTPPATAAPAVTRVSQVEFSGDGRRAVILLEGQQEQTRGRIYVVLVWDGIGGGEGTFRNLPIPENAIVNRVALCPSAGDLVAAAIQIQDTNGTHGEARVWSTGPDPIVAHHPDKAPIRHVGFSPDGKWLVTCGGAVTGSAELWLTSDFRPVPNAKVPPAKPVSRGHCVHDAPVGFAAFNGALDQPTDRVITCGDDGKAVVTTITPVLPPNPAAPGIQWAGVLRWGNALSHGAKILWADFSPDGRYVVTASRDRKARVWDVQTESLAFPHLHHTGSVTWIGFGADGRTVGSVSGGVTNNGTSTGTAQVWELRHNDRAWYLPTAGSIRYAGGNLRDGYFVTVSTDQGRTETRAWKAPPDRLSFAPETDTPPWVGGDRVNFAAVNAPGDRIVTLSGPIAFLDLGQKTPRPLEHTGVVNYACFSPSGRLLVTAAGDVGQQNGEVKFWDAGTGEEEKTAPERRAGDWAFQFVTVSPDGDWVVATGGPAAGVATRPDSVRAVLWPIDAQGRPGPTIELKGGHIEPVTFAAFGPPGPNGRYVVTTGIDDRACVWFLNIDKTVSLVRTLTKHTADVVLAAFDRDGKYFVTVGADSKAIVWEAATGRDVMVLEHGGQITTAAFDRDGKYLVTAGHDGKARLWQFQVEAGDDRLNPPSLIAAFDHHGGVLAATFSADGTRLRTLSRPALGGGRAGFASAIEKPGVWVMEWELRPDTRALDVIRDEGEIVARRVFDERVRDLSNIPVDRLTELWDKRRAVYLAWAKSRGEPGMPPLAIREARRAEADVRWSAREARRAEATELWATADWHLRRAIKQIETDQALCDTLPPKLRVELYSSRAQITLRRAAGRVDWDAVIADYAAARALADKTSTATQVELDMNIAVARLSAIPSQPEKQHRHLADAEDDYTRACNLGIRDPRTESRLGDAYRKLGQRDQGPSPVPLPTTERQKYAAQAYKHYTESIELSRLLWRGHTREADILDPEILSRRSEMAETLGKWDDVISDCTTVINNWPGGERNTELYHRRAQALNKKDDPALAPAAIGDYLQVARLYASQHDTSTFRSALDSPRDVRALGEALALARRHAPNRVPEILKAKGMRLAQLARVSGGNRPQAIKDLEEASANEEIAKDWELWKTLGEAYAATLDWKKATEKYEQAVQKAEAAAVSSQQRVALLQQLAGAWAQAQQWDAADRAYERAIALANTSKMADGEVARVWAAKASTHVWAASVPGADSTHRATAIAAYSNALKLTDPTDLYSVYLLQERARAYAKVGGLDDMAADYDEAFKRQPTWTWLRLERARLWAENSKWEKARDDLLVYTAKAPVNSISGWYELAVVQLRLKDDAGYRKTCETVLTRFELTTFPYEANQTAWIIALGSPPGADPARAVAIAEVASKSLRSHTYLNTLGVAQYRAKNDAAIATLQEACKAYTGMPGAPPAVKDEGSVTDQLFLAMAYHRNNKPDEAKKWLAKALTGLEAIERVKEEGLQPSVWQRIEWSLRREEAQNLIGPVK